LGILDLSKAALETRQQKKVCNTRGVFWVVSRHIRQCSYKLTVSVTRSILGGVWERESLKQ